MKLRQVFIALGLLVGCLTLVICYCACIVASRSERELEELNENHSGNTENIS